jgi:hypothetical protein
VSRIYWHGQHQTSELLGSERAYMGTLCTDMAMPAVSRRFLGNDPHPFRRILAPGAAPWLDSDERLRTYLGQSGDEDLIFDGGRHDVFATVLNTVIATESPVLCLLARLHGSCEIHAWVAEEDREWLAGVIDTGRESNILRADMGWESVSAHLRNGDGGPVVTSYSVCDAFPSMGACDWMDPAWPAEMVASNSYDYSELTAAQKEAVDARQDEWYELDRDEQWRLAFEGLQSDPYRRITPENLTKQGFHSGKSLWDATVSEEWRSHKA